MTTRHATFRAMFITAVTTLSLAAGGWAAVPSFAAVPTTTAPSTTAPTTTAPSTTASGAVVVLLKNQLTTTPAGRAHGAQRTSLAKAAQQSVLATLPGTKPGKIRQFSVGDAFAATVSPAQADALATNPDVAAVVPDVRIPTVAPTPVTAAVNANPSACPSDSAKPLLEPEGLSLIQAANSDGTLSASQLADGTGVKVGVLADGVNINVPDFVRADGSNVVSAQVDFTGVPTPGGEETTGDISTIAAQGAVHDLHDANANIPAGCTVRIDGVAPGADVVALDGIGLFTPLSDVLQGIDYATNVAHVDVLNESFGIDTINNVGARDALQLFNDEAVAAGVTVVAASGDAGTTGTEGAPAIDQNVIAVGATTSLRTVAQQGIVGTNGKWANDNIAEFSSSGFTTTGSTIDLVAPGFEGWAANGDSVGGITPFGGTSEAAPYVAGTAALVIQAYRSTHGAASPAPALVKEILTSTADDLGVSAQDQGAGLLDARSAVEAALTAPGASGKAAPVASHILLSSDQINVAGSGGTTQKVTDTVTNAGPAAITVAPSVRALQPVSSTTQTVTGAGSTRTSVSTFVDGECDVLRVRVFNPAIVLGSGEVELFDPEGTLQNLSLPQGSSSYAMLTARSCEAGDWTVSLPASLTGTSKVEVDTYRNAPAGQVDTASFRLAPGASRKVTAKVTLAADGGDAADSMEFATSTGHTASVPLTLRTVVPLRAKGTTIHGTFTGGNGRNTFGNEQRFVYAVDVPSGAAAVHAAFSLNVPSDEDADGVTGDLIAPDGEVADHTTAGLPLGGIIPPGGASIPANFDLTSLTPVKGRWLVVFTEISPANDIAQQFTATLDTTSPAVFSAASLPNSASRVLATGKTVEVPVTVTNTSANPLTIQADPRTTKFENYQLTPTLAGVVPTSSTQTLPTLFFSFVVPLGTKSFSASSAAQVPTMVAVQAPEGGTFVASDLTQSQQGSTVSTATVSEKTPSVTPGDWGVSAAGIGPDTTIAPIITTTLTGSVLTQGFDRTMSVADDDTSGIGSDPYLPDVDVNAPAAAVIPPVLAPGASLTFRMAITPTGKAGSVVHGVLNIVTDGGATAVAAIPYTYTVGKHATKD